VGAREWEDQVTWGKAEFSGQDRYGIFVAFSLWDISFLKKRDRVEGKVTVGF
jgi:hypothetical protein